MSLASNKQLVRDVYAAIDAHEFDPLFDFCPEDMVCHMVGLPQSLDREGMIEFIKSAYAVFPDFTHQLDDLLAEENRVVVRVTNHATHQNEFEGLAPTGKRITYASVHMINVVDGAIKEW